MVVMPRQRLYSKEDTVRFNMLMKRTHYEELQELAGYEGRSVADLIRQMVADALRDREESTKITKRRQ